jgi:Flp pilus assembly protein TadD
MAKLKPSAPGLKFAPGVLILAVAMVAAAGTLGAQRQPTPDEARSELQRAERSFSEARYEDAYRRYNEVLGAGDQELGIAALKGMIRSGLRLSSFQIARREAEALHAVTEDADALTLYSDALWGDGMFDEAEAAAAAALERYPDSPRARFGVARSLAARGRLDEAMRETLTAATAAPGDSEILVLLAQLHERRFQYEDAIRVYEDYVDLLPRRIRDEGEAAKIKIRLLSSFRGRTPVAFEGADRLHTVPFTMRNKKVVFDAQLNGKPVEFVLDTGAEQTAITRATASRAGVREIVETLITGVGPPSLRKLAVGRADSLTIGGLTIRDFPVSIRRENIPGSEPWQNEAFSPASFGLSVVVDYRRQEVTLGRELPQEPADFRLPLRVYRLPLVRGLLNGQHPAYFVVDTGGELMSISKETATQLAMRPPRTIPIKVWGVTGLDPDAFLLPGVNLSFDQIEYRNTGVAVLNLRPPSVLLGFQLGGILGYKFLGGYRVGMDFARGELRLSEL